MEVSTGLVAGSHQRNELIVFRRNEYAAKPLLQQSSRQICQICGDEIGSTVDGGDPFIACNECAFPVCRTCYDYERKEGSQVCPQCKTRYKRLKGCPRVEGDEEEDDIDDVENEFNFDLNKEKEDSKSHSHTPKALQPQVSLLTNNQDCVSGSVNEVDDDIPLEQHALVLLGSGGYSEGKSISLDPAKDLAAYGYGSVAWKERIENWKQKQGKLQMTGNGSGSIDPDGDEDDELDLSLSNEGRQPLSRKLPVPSSQINPYRMIIIIRLIVLAFFFHYRVTHPVTDAYGLWLTSVICEIWFALSWILDQFPKWLPVDRETYLDRLSLRYENEGQPSQLSSVDIFVSTVDPLKEPPLVTANTILSILAVDYPVDKVSCYVSDDGAAMLTFEALSEVSEFAKKWVPFCKKFDVEPRAPEPYFAQKFDYLKDKVLTSFIKERRSMKREYEELKVRINALVAKAQKVPEEGWRMQDGSSWPGNNVGDHPQMIQVFLGQNGGHDVEGNGLPRLVYMSREKRPGFNHHKKAGAMNALVRVSAVLTNAPFVLNLDCGQYINNSKALREAMCFMMDPLLGKRVCFVQFPQRFDGIDIHDRYANRNVLFFDINMKGLDGIQGPIYVGSGCVFRRQALYGIDAPKKKKSKSRTCNCWFKWLCRRGEKNKDKMKHHLETSPMISQRDDKESYALVVSGENHQGSKAENCSPNSKNKLEKKFGQSPVFIASTFQENGGILQSASPASILREAIHVISCGYEEKTDWGKEVGWIYGSVSEDILTGLKMHCHGWRSIYCMPPSPAFKQSPPINLSESLHRVLHWALGSTQIFLSRHCPLWYGYGSGLKCLERFSYINATTYPLTSLPLLAYSTLPAICFLTGKFITQLDNNATLWFLSLFLCIFATTVLETRWSGVGIDEWWRNEQFWVICGVSAHLFAVFQCLIKILAGVNNTKNGDEKELFCAMKWTIILVPPTTLLIINIIGVGAGISDAMNNGYDSWGPLVCKLMFAFWVIAHLYPFLKGLLGRQNRTPTIIVVWSILLASVFSLLWLRIDPFLGNSDGLVLEDCGIDCN